MDEPQDVAKDTSRDGESVMGQDDSSGHDGRKDTPKDWEGET